VFGWRKVQVGSYPGNLSVDFFRERLPFIARPQSRFNMPHLDAVIVAQQGGYHNRGRIPLNQDPVRMQVLQHRVQPGQNISRQLCEPLVGPHQIKVNIWLDIENIQNLVQHLPVLCGHTDLGINPRRSGQVQHHRRHLDRLWACPKDG